MQNFDYKLSVGASDEKEADKKIKAVTTLLKKLNEKELSKLAHIVTNDPVKTALAKRALGV